MKAWALATLLSGAAVLSGAWLWHAEPAASATPPAPPPPHTAALAPRERPTREAAPLDAKPLEAKPAPAKRRYSVAAIGDSLSDPKAHGGKYLTYLSSHCKLSRFDAWGKGGNMVSQMKKRFARDILGEGGVERPKYSHLVVLGGIADIGSNETAGRTLEKIQTDLSAMYRMAHDKGITVIALTIPPWGAYYEYNDERHRMMLAMNDWIRKKPEPVSHVVDVFPKLVCKERELCAEFASDKIHWNKKGHDLVGQMLLEQIFSDCE